MTSFVHSGFRHDLQIHRCYVRSAVHWSVFIARYCAGPLVICAVGSLMWMVL